MQSKPVGSLVVFGFYAFLCVIGLAIYTAVFSTLGYLAGAVAGVAAAAVTANWIAIRVFERGRFLDAGLWWTSSSLRNLSTGLLLGMGTALAITVGPLALGLADLVSDPQAPTSYTTGAYVSAILLVGAAAEELMFRGYAFQVLARAFGPVATLAVTSLLFGLVHTSNLNFSRLALLNTVGFGVVLGVAMLRSNALWLPIGLHFGWNWVPPLIGVNLSGFTMRISGYSLQWRLSDLWSGGAYGPEGGLLTTAVVLALLAYLVTAPVRRETPPSRPETLSAERPSEA